MNVIRNKLLIWCLCVIEVGSSARKSCLYRCSHVQFMWNY